LVDTDLSLLTDFPSFAAGLWKLYDKNGNHVRFTLNPAQKLVWAVIENQMTHGRPVRVRVLKFRQAGLSTLITAILTHATITNEGYAALSIADKQELVEGWLRRCNRWMEQLPDKPHLGATNKQELWFDSMESRYSIASAEGTTPGMGATIRAIHASEVASWRNPDTVFSDLLPAVPPGPGTMVIQESTGRSVGDWWYQRYFEGKEKDCEYDSIFLPWYIQPEYRLADTSDILSLNEEEKTLSRLGIDKGQLAWRRRQLFTEFHGDLDRFANQFPSTEDEAFLGVGRQVFPPEMCARARETVRDPIWAGEIIPKRNPAEFELVESAAGNLLVWANPIACETYAIGADCQWGDQGEDPDYDVAYVEHCRSGKVVACYRGRMSMGDWSRTLASLGHYYNGAWLAPERNSKAAEGVILVLLGQAGNSWRYPNLWVRDDTKAFGGRAAKDYGWLTTQHTKPELIIYTMEQMNSSWGMDWADPRAVDEMSAYIRDEKNKLTAPEGQHDDCLMARMITSWVSKWARNTLAIEPMKEDWGGMNPTTRRVMARLLESDAEADKAKQEEW